MFATDQPGPMDVATAAALPLVAMPLDGAFEPLPTPGRRLLVAHDGTYLEARSPALYVRVRLSEHDLPYGSIGPAITLPFGPIPRVIARQLMEKALAAHPNEMAALVVASDVTPGAYILHQPVGRSTGGSVSYVDTGYDESLLVVDAHSHGHYGAMFSSTDDCSDQSRIGPHISLVFGRCATREQCEISVRVCVGRYLISLSVACLAGLFA